MKNNVRPVPLVILSALVLASCAGGAANGGAPPTPPRVPVSDELTSRGRVLLNRGEALAASQWLEAALSAGAVERETLPLLVVAEIRAGRLREARLSARRLAELEPERPGLTTLIRALDEVVNAAAAPKTEGAR